MIYPTLFQNDMYYSNKHPYDRKRTNKLLPFFSRLSCTMKKNDEENMSKSLLIFTIIKSTYTK